MSDFYRSIDDPTKELLEADLLLDKADALLHRHKPTTPPSANTFAELPILTDVVPEFELQEPALNPTESSPAPHATAPEVKPIDNTPESIELVEYLISLDTEIARSVEAWMAAEVPQVVARELDQLTARINEQVIAHARATLLPSLSEQIANRIAQIPAVKS